MPDPYRLIGPLIRRLDPELAHNLTLRALALGLAGWGRGPDDPILATRLLGRDFPNPIGLAAGFDKNAQVMDAMLGLGFGFVEAGSVTPRPQPGNPKPRLFRLPEQQAVINRMGFNNDGLAVFVARLAARRQRGKQGIIGANLGKNKDTADAAADYEQGITAVEGLADYMVINISSPNTPGLRALQDRGALEALLARAMAARTQSTPLLLKVAPDLTVADQEDIAAVACESGIDGLMISNTTIARPEGLPPHLAQEAGGLSGAPLFAASTAMLANFYRLTGGKLPLIGVGGIASGADAYAKIQAGASLVQLYTALIYQGPALVERIKRDLAALLRRDGFSSLAAAVGTKTYSLDSK